tara:strand:+ start:345 stop:743 length:399 start_codon:yes stop_codon:yes gene_type:complete
MSDGPWYEYQGPNAEEVRKDVLSCMNIVKIGKDQYEKEKDKIIQDALMKIIPDSRNDFGSYRGYATFGVKKELTNEVIEEVRKGYALLIIEKKFIPFVTHQLYKPGGIMAKKVARYTMVGKILSGRHQEWLN